MFPSVGGAARHSGSLGRHLRRLVARQLGAHFTAHLARHLAVDIILENNPNDIRVAQALLGHTRAKTTEEMYGARLTSAANLFYAGLIEEQRREISKGRRPKQPRAA